MLRSAGAAVLLSTLPWSLRYAWGQQTFELIVIGGGTAGLPAAISAAERGARVLVIEKASLLGGTLYMSHGEMAAANTVFQSARGIEDSADAFYDDVMRINQGTSDPVLTRLWADHGGEAINWLAKNGFQIASDLPVKGKSFDFYTTPRYLWGPQQGVSILNVIEPLLAAHVEAGRITIITGAAVVDLVRDQNGAVTGVVTQDDDGIRSDFRALNVIIASGGCASNPAVFEATHGVPLYGQFANPFSQGDGLYLGLGAGGYLRGAENYISVFGSIASDDRIPSPLLASMVTAPEVRSPWEIYVNAYGHRFVQEDHPSLAHRARALDIQPGHRFWVIFDQSILEQAPPLIANWPRDRFLESFNQHPMFARAATLSELGVVTGVQPANLKQSVAEFNGSLRKQQPDPHNRLYRPLPIIRPPFYAVRSQGWTLKSFAGLAVNKDLQMITSEGDPIANLYAAGEVLGGGSTGGKAYTNGSNVTPAVTFGRLLGSRILEF